MNPTASEAARALVNLAAWVLLHFLWQGALAGICLWAVLALVRRDDPRLRYALSCAALAVMLALPPATAAWIAAAPAPVPVSSGSPSAAITLPPPVAPARDAGPASVQPAGRSESTSFSLRSLLQPMLPWVFALWLAGFVVLSVRQVGGWGQARLMVSAATRPRRGTWEESLLRVARRMGITRRIRLLASGAARVPSVVGWTRPVILVPLGMITGLPVRQIEAILAHELAHITRHDYLVNLLQAAAETALFYHPATWWVSARIRQERENCCDDLAVSVCGDRIGYVRALAAVESMRDPATSPALAATGGSLLRRIRRISGAEAEIAGRPSPAPLALLLLATLVVLAGARIAPATEAPAEPAAPLRDQAAPSPPSPLPAEPAPDPADGRNAAPLEPAAARTVPADRGPRGEAAAPTDAATFIPVRADRLDPDVTGDWRAATRRHGLHLQLRPDSGWGSRGEASFLIGLEEIQGLTRGPELRFEIRREAGTFYFDGRMESEPGGRDWSGAGTFRFVANPDYVREMDRLGYSIGRGREIYEMALFDVTTGYVRELHDLGYRNVGRQRLVEFRIHGVEPAEIREWLGLGYRDIPEQRLVELRIHGVTPDYARDIEAAGLGRLPRQQLIEMRIHGVSADEAQRFAEIGYPGLPAEKLIELKIHGVTPEYVEEMQEAGMRGLPVQRLLDLKIHGISPEWAEEMMDRQAGPHSAEGLVEMKIHGMTPEFEDELRSAGLGELEPERLLKLKIHGVSAGEIASLREEGVAPFGVEGALQMRIHGVTPAFVRDLAELGYRGLTAEEFVRMRINGVTAAFVRDLSDLGYDEMPVATLIRLRIHGVSAGYIEEANGEAGRRLDIEEIIDMRIHGSRRGRHGV